MLCIDLFCGLGGWAEGFLAEGYRVLGFDIERHRYPKANTGARKSTTGSWDTHRTNYTSDHSWEVELTDDEMDEYPGQLVLQDVLTLDGRQFKGAAVIVASPPCTDYAQWGMRMFHPNPPQPDLRLWQAATRIAAEAKVPLVVENVRGAQYFHGRASWKCGPYYLWGEVPALWPDMTLKRKNVIDDVRAGVRRGLKTAADMPSHSARRRECTARAAKIPFPLAQHIAKTYKPA